ncbi:hypothetical protein BDN67DRAFT_978185 [Paxillus ammoniavirescens]|nr:hypothetical protein BDN67DRAFT_978185 [Paxillus ammoniavirescens]
MGQLALHQEANQMSPKSNGCVRVNQDTHRSIWFGLNPLKYPAARLVSNRAAAPFSKSNTFASVRVMPPLEIFTVDFSPGLQDGLHGLCTLKVTVGYLFKCDMVTATQGKIECPSSERGLQKSGSRLGCGPSEVQLETNRFFPRLRNSALDP